MSAKPSFSVPTLELTRVIPALAEANAAKSEQDIMPTACYKQVDRCIDLKGRRYVMLKEHAQPLPKGQFTTPGKFWPSAPNPRESFNLFARMSAVGCSDMENKAAALALMGALLDRRLVCNGVPVQEWGLCKTKVTGSLITVVYKWDLAQPMSTWDAEAQNANHNFLYFVVRMNEVDTQPVTMYYDLSALQYGVLDSPHKTSMPIPYVFSDRESCVQTHPEVYAEACKWKSTENIRDEYLSLGQMLLNKELPLGEENDVEQRRKCIQLLLNFQKFKATLELVAQEMRK
jgi:hypothetical protein